MKYSEGFVMDMCSEFTKKDKHIEKLEETVQDLTLKLQETERMIAKLEKEVKELTAENEFLLK